MSPLQFSCCASYAFLPRPLPAYGWFSSIVSHPPPRSPRSVGATRYVAIPAPIFGYPRSPGSLRAQILVYQQLIAKSRLFRNLNRHPPTRRSANLALEQHPKRKICIPACGGNSGRSLKNPFGDEHFSRGLLPVPGHSSSHVPCSAKWAAQGVFNCRPPVHMGTAKGSLVKKMRKLFF